MQDFIKSCISIYKFQAKKLLPENELLVLVSILKNLD